MAVKFTEVLFTGAGAGFPVKPGRMSCRIPDVSSMFPIPLDISFQNSYAVFCFIKRELNRALRFGTALPVALRCAA